MPNVTVTLTEAQAIYVQQLVGLEQAKCNLEMCQAALSLPDNPTTDDEKNDRKAAWKPYGDREKNIYAICQAISAGWPKQNV